MGHNTPAAESLPDFKELYDAEESHFWFKTRNRVLETVVQSLVRDLEPGYGFLEVGCGTGNVLRMLERTCKYGRVVGMDLHKEALAFARDRVRCELVCADVHRWPFSTPFDVIGLFDVLEHLEDDAGILKAIRDRIKPGGALLLTVPAHQSLWSDTDVYAGHFRRYSDARLRDLLASVGLAVEYSTYFMSALWPAMFLSRSLPSLVRKKEVDVMQHGRELALSHLKVSPLANKILCKSMSWERDLIGRRKPIPVGTSLLAIAKPRAVRSRRILKAA